MPGWLLKRQICEPRQHWLWCSLSVPFIGVSGVQCAEHSPPFLSHPFVVMSLCLITYRDILILRNIKFDTLFYRVYMKQVKPSFFSTFRGIDYTAFYPTSTQSTTIKHFSFSYGLPPSFGLSMDILREASNEGIKEWQGLLTMCTCGVKNEMFSNRIAKNISNID